MRRERGGGDLQTTALIHEAYARLVGGEPDRDSEPGTFFRHRQQTNAARACRCGPSGATHKSAAARHSKFLWTTCGSPLGSRGEDLLALDEALRELELIDPRAAKVVELRYFGGYTDKEVVEALGVALSTVRRDWEFARSWLFNQMHGRHTKP